MTSALRFFLCHFDWSFRNSFKEGAKRSFAAALPGDLFGFGVKVLPTSIGQSRRNFHGIHAPMENVPISVVTFIQLRDQIPAHNCQFHPAKPQEINSAAAEGKVLRGEWPPRSSFICRLSPRVMQISSRRPLRTQRPWSFVMGRGDIGARSAGSPRVLTGGKMCNAFSDRVSTTNKPFFPRFKKP